MEISIFLGLPSQSFWSDFWSDSERLFWEIHPLLNCCNPKRKLARPGYLWERPAWISSMCHDMEKRNGSALAMQIHLVFFVSKHSDTGTLIKKKNCGCVNGGPRPRLAQTFSQSCLQDKRPARLTVPTYVSYDVLVSHNLNETTKMDCVPIHERIALNRW